MNANIHNPHNPSLLHFRIMELMFILRPLSDASTIWLQNRVCLALKP